MTAQQIKWAASHDWFIKEQHGCVLAKSDMVSGDTILHSDFKLMKEWAGY